MQYEDIERQDVSSGMTIILKDAAEVASLNLESKKTGLSWSAVLFQLRNGSFVTDIYCEDSYTAKTVVGCCEMKRYDNIEEFAQAAIKSNMTKDLWLRAKKNSPEIDKFVMVW